MTRAEAPSCPPPPAPRRGRGRPRQADLDARILEAAVEELCLLGPSGLTFDGLAARAGVAKATIYRRWMKKVDIIIDAIDLLRDRAPIPDTGDLRADLANGLDNIMKAFISPQGAAIASVYAGRLRDPELAAAWDAKIQEPNLQRFEVLLAHGVATGRLQLALSLEETAQLLAGGAFMVLMGLLPWRPGLAAGMVRTVLDGIDRHGSTMTQGR